jgi:hypothetical protein
VFTSATSAQPSYCHRSLLPRAAKRALFAHSCARVKTSSPFLSTTSALLQQNTRGGIKSVPPPVDCQPLTVSSLTPAESALTHELRVSPGFGGTTPTATPLESALTDTHPVTPLESALTKKQGREDLSTEHLGHHAHPGCLGDGCHSSVGRPLSQCFAARACSAKLMAPFDNNLERSRLEHGFEV